jgi:hypothetical protein
MDRGPARTAKRVRALRICQQISQRFSQGPRVERAVQHAAASRRDHFRKGAVIG